MSIPVFDDLILTCARRSAGDYLIYGHAALQRQLIFNPCNRFHLVIDTYAAADPAWSESHSALRSHDLSGTREAGGRRGQARSRAIQEIGHPGARRHSDPAAVRPSSTLRAPSQSPAGADSAAPAPPTTSTASTRIVSLGGNQRPSQSSRVAGFGIVDHLSHSVRPDRWPTRIGSWNTTGPAASSPGDRTPAPERVEILGSTVTDRHGNYISAPTQPRASTNP